MCWWLTCRHYNKIWGWLRLIFGSLNVVIFFIGNREWLIQTSWRVDFKCWELFFKGFFFNVVLVLGCNYCWKIITFCESQWFPFSDKVVRINLVIFQKNYMIIVQGMICLYKNIQPIIKLPILTYVRIAKCLQWFSQTNNEIYSIQTMRCVMCI